jgi:hypothetical protein
LVTCEHKSLGDTGLGVQPPASYNPTLWKDAAWTILVNCHCLCHAWLKKAACFPKFSVTSSPPGTLVRDCIVGLKLTDHCIQLSIKIVWQFMLEYSQRRAFLVLHTHISLQRSVSLSLLVILYFLLSKLNYCLDYNVNLVHTCMWRGTPTIMSLHFFKSPRWQSCSLNLGL